MAQDTQQYEEIRQRLEEDLRTTRQDIEEIDREIPGLLNDPLDANTPTNHMAEQGSEVYEAERLNSVRIELNERIRLIEEALNRIDRGTFGICERCGERIAPERLEALPYATYCITCQEEVERGSGQRQGVKLDEPLTPDQGNQRGR